MANEGTREELIEVGLKQIHSAGYTATGINQILELADVPKGSFYHHFASKEAFAKEVQERYASGEQERWELFLIREAIEQHELPKTANADELAAVLVNNGEGARVRAKAEQSDKPLDPFFDVTFNVLLKG
jgi:TetR/AcrR family transcriptional repressor of nem operon